MLKVQQFFCKKKSPFSQLFLYLLVGADGFEPPKSLTTDLQSAPFGHSGTLPYLIRSFRYGFFGAGERSRTINLLITNQLLCQLSYASKKDGDPEGARTLDLQRDRLAF